MGNQKSKIKNIVYLIIIFALCSLLFSLPKVNAEGISLGVSPSILQIEAIPPADARAPFTIENKSDEPVKLKIGYKLFRASDKGDGQIEFLKDSDPFPGADEAIFEKIELVDDNFAIDSLELGPKQKKKLTLRVIAPKKEPFSDYYFSLIFLSEDASDEDASKDKEKTGTSTAIGGIAVNVLLSIGPKDNAKGYIEHFSTPWYRESGPVPFTLQVKNAGSHFITPKGVILIKNMFGQTVGKIDIGPENILAGTSRYLNDSKTVNLNPENSHSGSNSLREERSHPQVIWPDTFLLGFYTASLTLSISDNGPIYNNSIHFIAFPAKLMMGMLIAIVIIILAYVRVKKRMNQ